MLNAPARRGVLARERSALHVVWRIAGASLAAGLIGLAPLRAAAQEAAAPGISVPPTIAAAASSEAVLPIEIGPAGAIPQRSFVSLRGLPPAVAVKEGHAVGPGRWAVPLSALPSLKVQIPAGVSGRSEIVINLIAVDGRLLAQGKSALVIEPDALAGEALARAERLLARGEGHLGNGNIMAARDFFARAAEAGLAASAFRMATTYDPVTLERLKVQGVAPDIALARKWYERARDLGAAEAAEALGRLGR